MFNVKIPFYSIMLMISLISNIFIVRLISMKYSIKRIEIICLLLYENIGIIIGAKTLSFIQNYKELGGRGTQFDYIKIGFSSYGAVIGAILFLFLIGLRFSISLKEILYIFMPPMALMYAIGKIGCFLVGCCYGIKYSGFGSVVYNYAKSTPEHTQLFPIQMVEAIFFVIIFIYMIIKTKRNRFNMKTVGICTVLGGLGKFAFEFLRASHIGKIISFTQIFSLLCVAIGIAFLLKEEISHITMTK